MNVAPGTEVIGARVTGVSLAERPEGPVLEALETALEAHGVLIFPDQGDVTPAQQVAFSTAFGPLELVELDHALLPGHPEIFVVGNTGEKLVTFSPSDPDGELEWHTDHIHREVPARASLLLAREVPPVGGDTLFACMYTAYETLPAEKRALCDRLEVVNDVAGLGAYISRQGHEKIHRGDPEDLIENPVIWPLVRAHPRTGRRALYFGNQVSVGIVGWEAEEALRFIADLTEHACQTAHRYRHGWNAGDAVLWDNRRVLHAGTPYDLQGTRRRLHRTTVRETAEIRLVG